MISILFKFFPFYIIFGHCNRIIEPTKIKLKYKNLVIALDVTYWYFSIFSVGPTPRPISMQNFKFPPLLELP